MLGKNKKMGDSKSISIGISFYVKPKGKKRRKKVSFLARR